ncbi:LOB domain-containing protein 37 [Dichanthelium oligosanthes]|uniref:LOB domain-containing protein 37 n=1 Tax=Dichanthelium oligosanthes TaxID=888268 RepID=A0A1E5UZN8_9POAL|nr:LOB domain-containing protein 37 [Dichanthelium oligosanthes]
MSCNGCRVLRKGCSEACVLRPCLQWIDGADAQGHATVFVAKFFGRAGLMSFLTAVPEPQRPAVFQSLLYEAAGRTINPVTGAVGLLGAGSWHLCQAAVETVLRGGGIRPLPELDGGDGGLHAADGSFAFTARRAAGCSTFSAAKRATTASAHVAVAGAPEPSCDLGLCLSPGSPPASGERRPRRAGTPSMTSEESVTTTSGGGGGGGGGGGREPELLNLFV